MLAAKSMDIRDNFKDWCDKISMGETGFTYLKILVIKFLIHQSILPIKR